MDLLPKVFRTEGDMVDFDPSKIYNSILKETGIRETDANHITELVVRRIISSGIKFLSGPHIREIVCSILSEQHFEQERKLYTRIGMPLMDYEEILEKGPQSKRGIINPERIHHWAANKIAEEYSLLRILDDEEQKAHLYGDIFIHKLKYFDLRPLSQIWDPRIILRNGLPPIKQTYSCKSGPANNLKEAVNHLAKWLGMTQGEFSGDQGFNFVTVFLAPYAKGLSDVEIKRGMKSLIYEINQLSALISQDTPITTIYCCPTILNLFSELPAISSQGKIEGTYGDYNSECLKLFDAITNVYKEGDYYGNAFNFPKHIIYIKKNWLSDYDKSYSNIMEEILNMKTPYIINLCSDWLNNEINEQFSGIDYHNYGTLQNISLNLPRYSYISKDEDKFFEILRDKIEFCSGILNKKYEIIEKRLKTHHLPLCSGVIDNQEPLFKLENQNLSLNFVGLNEAVKFLTDDELHESSDAFNLGKKIIKEMKNICVKITERDKKRYVLQENLSNKVIYRFANLDLKHFKKIAIPQLDKKGNYYTNSAQFRKDVDIELYERIYKQGEFDELIQNGRIIKHISLKDLKSNQILKDLIFNVCDKSTIACLKFVL